MLWGQIADSSRFGRKTVLLIGLAGTSMSAMIRALDLVRNIANPESSALVHRLRILHFLLAGTRLQVHWRHHERQHWCAENHVRAG